MKIFNSSQVQKAYKIYSKNNNIKKANSIAKLSKRDEVSLSSKAVEYQYAMKAFKELPEVREQKVNEIKKRIESGTYKIDIQKIVDKIFS
ncbi:flagellar biosynthesis anti-sigma factor FlgM [Clostridiaceae bacterium M8S5]|nr:flagellar biosynthesis anti-sigma factor FlgM [Clostridiaceae bacterium M8S5]